MKYSLDTIHQKTRLISFPAGSLGCNCSIVIDTDSNHAIIIDPGDHPGFIKNIIHSEELTVKRIVHTHAHFDHIAASDELKQTWNCPLHLHADDLPLYETIESQGNWFGFKVSPPGKIDSYLSDQETFCLQDSKTSLTTMHTPGHTQGSCCFYSEIFSTPILFSGDTLFNESIGRTDLPGGDSQLIIKSIKNRLLPLPEETLVIPGHGSHTWLHHEKKHNPFF